MIYNPYKSYIYIIQWGSSIYHLEILLVPSMGCTSKTIESQDLTPQKRPPSSARETAPEPSSGFYFCS